MSKSRSTRTTNGGRPDVRRQQVRRISVRSVRRDPPDVRKLGRAIIRMAVLEAEAERAAQNHVEGQADQSAQPVQNVEVNHDQ